MPHRAVVARRLGVSETTVRVVAERFVDSGGDVGATIIVLQQSGCGIHQRDAPGFRAFAVQGD